jgi:hypothetical protein
MKYHQKCHFLVAICRSCTEHTAKLVVTIVGSVFLIKSLSVASLTEGLRHGKPALTGNRVSKCQPPASEETLHLLKIFLRTSSCSISSLFSVTDLHIFQRMCLHKPYVV